MDRHPITGWQARLELDFARRDEATILEGRRHFGPLRVQKALHPEGPGVCHAIVLHPPAGICGGDRLTIAVAVQDAGHALLTTPGAGKWYRSSGQQAGQALDFRVGPGATLEWLPQESIVFDGALGAMDSRISLEDGARFIGWEVLCLGRRASGERFERGELRLSTRIESAGAPIWAERGKIAGGSALQDAAIGLAGRTVSATLLAAGAAIAPALLAECRTVEATEAGALTGITALPQLLVARYLGDSSEAARAWLVALWRVLRPALTGREAQPPRIWNT
ncbi:MAG TPA: urease accessory protein UreD [Rhodocyclaceae bacterium]|nr:urease accessory protein UreD [Rhodocyclaceae bacterium]